MRPDRGGNLAVTRDVGMAKIAQASAGHAQASAGSTNDSAQEAFMAILIRRAQNRSDRQDLTEKRESGKS